MPQPPRKRPPRKTPAKKAPAKKAVARKAPAKRGALQAVPDVPPPPPAELVPALPEPEPEVFEPAHLAHQLRLRGESWQAAATMAGYPSTSACQHAVTAYIQRAAMARSNEQRELALQTQIDRYESILRSWWDLGTAGRDDKAAAILLKTLSQLDRVQKLDDMEQSTGAAVMVIAGTEEEYIARLRAIDEAPPP